MAPPGAGHSLGVGDLHCQPGCALLSGTWGRLHPRPSVRSLEVTLGSPWPGGPGWGGPRGCPPDRAVPRQSHPRCCWTRSRRPSWRATKDLLEGVLCGAVKQLKVTLAKPDSALYLSLMYLAKMKPNIFATEGAIEVSHRPPCRGVGSGRWAALDGPPCHRAVSLAGPVQPPAAGRSISFQGQGTAWCP